MYLGIDAVLACILLTRSTIPRHVPEVIVTHLQPSQSETTYGMARRLIACTWPGKKGVQSVAESVPPSRYKIRPIRAVIQRVSKHGLEGFARLVVQSAHREFNNLAPLSRRSINTPHTRTAHDLPRQTCIEQSLEHDLLRFCPMLQMLSNPLPLPMER